MDQFVVDVTGAEGVRQDDNVVVSGRQGEEETNAEEMAALTSTINYEVVTSILARVTRVYIKGGGSGRGKAICGRMNLTGECMSRRHGLDNLRK